jgi:hypothetical protein
VPVVKRAEMQKDEEIKRKDEEIQYLLSELLVSEEERLEAAKANQKQEMNEILRKCQEALKLVKEEKEQALKQKSLSLDKIN